MKKILKSLVVEKEEGEAGKEKAKKRQTEG